METHYTSYTKTINGTPFYFVKKYQTFPEFKNVPPVLETYGMHTNFKKACNIAMVFDKELQQQLLQKIENETAKTKVIHLPTGKAEIYNLRRKQPIFPSLLRLIGLR